MLSLCPMKGGHKSDTQQHRYVLLRFSYFIEPKPQSIALGSGFFHSILSLPDSYYWKILNSKVQTVFILFLRLSIWYEEKNKNISFRKLDSQGT